MISSSTCFISIEPFGMISIRQPVWRQVHGAIIVKPLEVPRNLPFNHIRSHAPTTKQSYTLLLYLCMFYVASRAFAQEPFLTYKYESTTLIAILFLKVTVKGPFITKIISAKEDKMTPRLSHVHDTSRTLSVEPVSPKRKFGLRGHLQSSNAAGMNS
jgi:hypothetical protein